MMIVALVQHHRDLELQQVPGPTKRRIRSLQTIKDPPGTKGRGDEEHVNQYDFGRNDQNVANSE